MIWKTIKNVDYDNEDLYILFDDDTITHISAWFCYDQALLSVDHNAKPDPYILCELWVITEAEQEAIEAEQSRKWKEQMAKDNKQRDLNELKRLKKKYE